MDYLSEIINKFSMINISPEWIVIVVSGVLVIVGAWRLIASRKANAISIHPKQLEIYNAFNELTFYVNTNGLGLEAHEIAKFNQVFKKSEFYFGESFSKQLKRYFEICEELADLNRRYMRDIGKNKDKEIRNIEQKQDVLQDEEIMLSKEIEENFKSILKLQGNECQT